MAKEQRRYTDQQRADLVVMLLAKGYPDTRGALQEVADYAKVSPDVLRRWWKRTQNPPPDTLVAKTRLSLADHLEEIAHQLIDAIPAKIEDAYLGNVTESLEAIIDKIQLLKGEPTERSEQTVNLPTDARDKLQRLVTDRAERERAQPPAEPVDGSGGGSAAVRLALLGKGQATTATG